MIERIAAFLLCDALLLVFGYALIRCYRGEYDIYHGYGTRPHSQLYRLESCKLVAVATLVLYKYGTIPAVT